MYRSVKQWARIPFKVLHNTGYNMYGEKQYDAPVDALCYPVAESEYIINAEGHSVLSMTRLYIPAEDIVIGDTDAIIFEGKEQSLQKIVHYYEGNTGNRDVTVVYL